VSNENSESETPLNETAGNSLNEIKTEPSATTEMNSVVLPPKNGQFNFHQSKKRKGMRVSQNLPPEETVPGKPKIELESTTIKVSSSPPAVSISPVPSVPTIKKDSEPCQSSSSPNPELLEPSLVELAEKLERSNALQILPIRPSVITKQEPSSCDVESNNGSSPSPSKKARTEPFPSIPSVTVSEVSFVPGKGNYLRAGATSGPQRNERMSPLGESDKTRLSAIGSNKGLPASWNKGNVMNSEIQNSYKNIQPAHQGSLYSNSSASSLKSNNSESPEKTTLSITAIETDSRRRSVRRDLQIQNFFFNFFLAITNFLIYFLGLSYGLGFSVTLLTHQQNLWRPITQRRDAHAAPTTIPSGPTFQRHFQLPCSQRGSTGFQREATEAKL